MYLCTMSIVPKHLLEVTSALTAYTTYLIDRLPVFFNKGDTTIAFSLSFTIILPSHATHSNWPFISNHRKEKE